jgi:hypothetical protein
MACLISFILSGYLLRLKPCAVAVGTAGYLIITMFVSQIRMLMSRGSIAVVSISPFLRLKILVYGSLIKWITTISKAGFHI